MKWVRKAVVSTDRYDYLLLTEGDAPREWHFAKLAVMTEADADEAIRLLERLRDFEFREGWSGHARLSRAADAFLSRVKP